MRIYQREVKPTSFLEASAYLNGKKSLKLAGNTYLEPREDGSIAVRYYATDIVTYYKNGSIKLNNGGWRTVTTKERMSAFTPFSISQKKYEWFVNMYANGVWTDLNIPFENGMVLNQREEVLKSEVA